MQKNIEEMTELEIAAYLATRLDQVLNEGVRLTIPEKLSIENHISRCADLIQEIEITR